MATGVTLSIEKWNSLSKMEQELLRKMGVGPAKTPAKPENEVPKTERKPRTNTTKEHGLGIVTDCLLCGSTDIDVYFMKRVSNGKETHLEAVRVSDSGYIPDRWELRRATSCRQCKATLRMLSKEELVNKVIKLASICKAHKYNATAPTSKGGPDATTDK